MILKFILFYFIFEVLTGIGVCAEVGAAIIIDWLRLLKTERILPFSSYLDIFQNKMKEITTRKDKKHIIPMAIPFLNMISIIPSLVEACKGIANSPEYMKESHITSNIERERIKEIKKDNGLNIANIILELEKFVIKPVDIETVLKPAEKGKYYQVGETYSFDECSYVSYGTNMKVTFGKIYGKLYAIFDACDEQEIRDLFPDFTLVDPDDITDEKMSLVFLRRPNEADICYIITHILYTRHTREIVESEVIPEELDGNDGVVKLTK